MTWLTRAEYARHTKLSKPRVTQLVNEGKLVIKKQGNKTLINVEKSQEFRDAGKEKIPTGGMAGKDNAMVLFKKSKAKREFFAAQSAELKAKKEAGELIEREAVESAFFSAGKKTRDSLMNIPARVASLFANETDANKIRDTLKNEINDALTHVQEALKKIND